MFLFVLLALLAFTPTAIHAQGLGLSLSISPPLLEVMIMPGKQITQTFAITNTGSDGYAKFTLAQLFPKDEYGNVAADDGADLTGPLPYAGWFTLPEKTFIRAGEEKTVTLKVSPPAAAPEKDYYFTLFYEIETDNTTKAKIGANILISVSNDGIPAKKAGEINLKAPKIIDSLQSLTYNLKIANAGQFLFKPVGAIEITPALGEKKILKLAPVNIISGSARVIPCLENETLKECKLNQKVLLGVYKAKVSFTADETGPIKYTAQTVTVALPFSIAFGLTTIILGYLAIKRLTKKTLP